MVAGQFVTEFANKEYESKILAVADTFTTVEQKFHRLARADTTDLWTPHLWSSLSSHSTFGSFRSERKRLQGKHLPRIPRNRLCNECRNTLHPNGLKGQKNCSARRFRCRNCGVIGHLEKECLKPKMVSTTVSTGSSTRHQSEIFIYKNKENQVSCERRQGLPDIPHLK